MNETTSKLLSELAQKLGTTTEYLWRVLVGQAPVSATITLVQMVFIILFGVVLYKIHKNLSKKTSNIRWEENAYERAEILVIPMAILTLIFIVLVFWAFASISDVVNGHNHR